LPSLAPAEAETALEAEPILLTGDRIRPLECTALRKVRDLQFACPLRRDLEG
jgi:DNA-directed RNA polymerase sigma subunit (sigma70/sigma32)